LLKSSAASRAATASRLAILILAGLLLLPASGRAGSAVRYALVVGNNHGTSNENLPDLKHAEAEARRIQERLVTLGNFDRDRVILLLGRGRRAILAAARQLAEQQRRDRQTLGRVATLFAFFYTGHGLQGQLLTADAPLTGADLAALFREAGATFTVGVFDACFSGSLNLSTLRAKGIRSTPGFNAFADLPREVLTAEGTMWFVSSRPDEVSYEDDRVGGVFSHFFVEGMARARADSIGVTLEDVWEYARLRTQQHTERSGRQQTPQKMVRNLTASGPLYFSFPTRRSATLAFAREVSGRFAIRYDAGQLVEVVQKTPGRRLAVATYPAEIVLERLDGRRVQQRFTLGAGQTVTVEDRGRWQARATLGSREETLHTKGPLFEELVLAHRVRSWTGLVSLGYRAALSPVLRSAAAVHHLVAGLRVDRGPLYLALATGYGHAADEYPAWGYTLHCFDLGLEAGAALDLGPLRAGLGATAALLVRDLRYRDGAGGASAGVGLGPSASLILRLGERPLPLFVVLRGGLRVERAAPVAPADGPAEWRAVPWVAVDLAARVF